MPFIKATINLTPEQLEQLSPLSAHFKGFRSGAILGQAWLIPTDMDYGVATFYFLTPEQYAIIDTAIRIAQTQ